MQTELEFSRSSSPVISYQEIEAVCDFLAGKDWVKASEIKAAINVDERRMRAIAEQSDGRILSGPGCPGYKLLTKSCRMQDVDETANRLESQGKRMIARAYSIRRRAHKTLAS